MKFSKKILFFLESSEIQFESRAKSKLNKKICSKIKKKIVLDRIGH